MLQGRQLFDAVRDCAAPAAFWWLGQASYIIKLGGTVLLIDPFLTPLAERRVPPLFSGADAAGVVDIVIGTHDHLDHIDPLAIPQLAQHTQATFIAPRAHTARMQALGVTPQRLMTLNDGERARVAGLTINAIKSSHEFFHQTPDGLYPHLGYVIEGVGKVLYHSGDTIWWEGLQARLAQWHYDVMLLPINGRDAKRLASNCIGNMLYQEAADLAGGLDVKLTVPMHYDMFESNAADPQLFVDYVGVKYPGRRTWVGPVTARVEF